MKPETRRLDATLARLGFGTRTEVRKLIRAGRVSLDGAVCRDPGARVTGAEVTVDDRPLERAPRHAMLHKPLGTTCSRDPREAPLIFELLPESWRLSGMNPAGRLDRDTTGLLVLSADGDVLHRLTHPRRKIAKRYRVSYRGELPADAITRAAVGFVLPGDDAPIRPLELTLHGGGQATVIATEGRHHLVRRFFAALGTEVVALHRDRIGALELPPDLAPGAARALSDAELLLALTPTAT